MSIIIQPGLVITDSLSGGGTINGDNPLIGYDNLITAANVSSTTEDADYPIENLANVSTNLRWQGATESPALDEYVTLNIQATELVDYVAFARHNLGSAQVPVSIEYLDENASPESWEELIAPVILANDSPALFRFTPATYSQLRVRMQVGTAAPTIAVMYAGTLLVLQRRIYVGHTPITYGRVTKVITNRSEAGHFLGRIVTNSMTETSFSLQNLTPAWVRSHLWPFILDAKTRPFFFAWRPQSYPREIGFCWLTNEPQPVNERSNGMMSCGFKMSGVV